MTQLESPRRRGRPPSGGREAILDAAVAVVRELGISKLTSRAVAARAGVSDASVYYHFKNRRGLLQAVYAHGMEPLNYIDDLPTGGDLDIVLGTAQASLEQFFDGILPILHAAQADAEVGQAVAAYVEDNDLGPHHGVEAIGTYLRERQLAGRISAAVDVDAVALLLIDAALGRSARRQMLYPEEQDERLPSSARTLAAIRQLLEPPRA